MNTRHLIYPLLAAVLAACASPQPARGPWPYPDPPRPGDPPPDLMPGVPSPRTQTESSRADVYPSEAAQVSGPAVLSLLSQAEQQLAAGSPDGAAAALERALRIEPRNPFVWQALAKVRLEQDLPEQSASLAGKSSSLARGNPHIESANWRLIAAARTRMGDYDGAEQARQQAQQAAQSRRF